MALGKKKKADAINCLIGENSIVEGDFSTSESVRIDGQIRGNVESKASIIVGSKGAVTGNILVDEIVIAGTVTGDIKATGKVIISSNGVVKGDISAKTLIIDENASFNGRSEMNAQMASDNIVKANTENKEDEKKNAS